MIYNLEREFDLELIEFLVQGIQSATVWKADVTDPTFGLRVWALKILQTLGNLQVQDQWRALPILSGLLIIVNEIRPFRGPITTLRGSFVTQVQQMLVNYSDSTLKFYTGTQANPSTLPVQVVAMSMAMTSQHLGKLSLDPLASKALLINIVTLVYQSPFLLNPDFRLGSILEPDPSLSLALNSPAFRHLRMFSGLTSYLIYNLPSKEVGLIFDTLAIISRFASSLSLKYDSLETSLLNVSAEKNEAVWTYFKLSLSSTLLPLSGSSGWIQKPVHSTEFMQHSIGISEIILQALSDLHFIVTQVSLSDFPLFTSVYKDCINSIMNRHHRQQFYEVLQRLGLPFFNHDSSIWTRIVSSSVFRAKLIFFLNFCETAFLAYSIESDWQFIPSTISPFLRPPLQPHMSPKVFNPIMEAAHMAYLRMFSYLASTFSPDFDTSGSLGLRNATASQKLQRTKNLHFLAAEGPRYLDCVLALFPAIFTSPQFLLAVDSIAMCLFPSVLRNDEKIEHMLEEIFRTATTKPCSPLPKVILYGNGTISGNTFFGVEANCYTHPTIRSVVVCALIHANAFLDVRLFEKWIEKTWRLILHLPNRSSPLWNQEQQFLKDEMFKMISRGDLGITRSSIARDWWYRVDK